jgi:hypothetical protein
MRNTAATNSFEERLFICDVRRRARKCGLFY